MAAGIEQLACYVPTFIQRRLVNNPDIPNHPVAERYSAAVLFADISGFTPLAIKLAELGPDGAERLDAILNDFYGELVDIVYDYGGDVVAYAGDAALAVWRSDNLPADRLLAAVARGSLEMQQKLHHYNADGTQLSMKICIGFGLITAMQIGGIQHSWRSLVVGEPMLQIRSAASHVQPGQIVLSPHAWKLARVQLRGESLPGDHLLLNSVVNAQALDTTIPSLTSKCVSALRCFVSSSVLARMDAGQAKWLADVRQVTVLFVKLEQIDTGASNVADCLHEMLRILQRTMTRYEGAVVNLIEDEKGMVAVLSFGLAPFSHEDDADRAIAAALDMQAQFNQRGVPTKIGISTGRVFSGPRGNSRRREYTITGEVVNLAARLMDQASGSVICDGATKAAVRRKVTFSKLPPIPLKGISHPVTAFQTVSATQESSLSAEAIAGRADELSMISEAILAARRGQKSILLFEGEAGIGKSTLLHEVRRRASDEGIRILFGECSAIEQATPFLAWRNPFSQIATLDSVSDLSERQRHTLEYLRAAGISDVRAPLLNSVLSLELAENEITSQLTSRARADNLHEILVQMLNAESHDEPLIVALEDVHWMDSSSWRLVQLVANRCESVSIVLTSRPPEHSVAEFDQFVKRMDVNRVVLDTLSKQETLDLIRAQLGTADLTTALTEFLYERSLGNPYFAEELTRYLRSEGLIHMVDDQYQLSASANNDGDANVPGSMRALITRRVDNLTLPQQLTLKTASVIGRVFGQKTLYDVYQDDHHRPKIDEHLDRFQSEKLIQTETPAPDPEFSFRHISLQQVTYDQIPVSNRRELHCSIARWYEATYEGVTRYFPLLAYHWGRGQEPVKEIDYLVKSGEAALRDFANREAAQSFEQALTRHREHYSDQLSAEQRRQRAAWHRKAGDAHFDLGNLPEAQAHLERSLKMLHQSPPQGMWPIRGDLIKQTVIQSLHRIAPAFFISTKSIGIGEETEVQQVALACQQLSQLHYLTVEMAAGLNRALRALNAAERAGQSPLLARAYAGMCLVTGMLRLHSVAKRYAALSESTARQTEHQPTIAYVLMATSVYRLGVGQWDQAFRDARESIELTEKLGDQNELGFSLAVKAMQHCLLAEFHEGERTYEQVFDVACQSENDVHQAWGFSGRGECLLRMGETEEAIECFLMAQELLIAKDHRTEDVRLNGMLSLANWRTNNRDAAMRYADSAMEAIDLTSVPTVSMLDALAGVAEVYSEHCRSDGGVESHRNAQRALANLTWYTKVFPIGRPRLLYFRGLWDWERGKSSRAHRIWHRSLDAALSWSMPFEIGLAHFRLGATSGDDSTEKSDHLSRALEIFEQLGTMHEFGEAKEFLS